MNKEEYDDRDYDPSAIEEDPRFVTCFKEAKIVLAFWGLFTALIMTVMYTIGAQPPAEYTYLWGLPLWFALVCAIVITFIIAAIFIVKHVFTDMPLDDTVSDAEEKGER